MNNSMVSENSNLVAYISEIKRLNIQGIVYTFIYILNPWAKVMGIMANLIGELD
jgi:hypothetical protein